MRMNGVLPVQVVVRVVRVLIHWVAPGTVEAWIVFAPLNLQLLAVVALVLGRTLAHVTTRLIGLKNKNELNPHLTVRVEIARALRFCPKIFKND